MDCVCPFKNLLWLFWLELFIGRYTFWNSMRPIITRLLDRICASSSLSASFIVIEFVIIISLCVYISSFLISKYFCAYFLWRTETYRTWISLYACVCANGIWEWVWEWDLHSVVQSERGRKKRNFLCLLCSLQVFSFTNIMRATHFLEHQILLLAPGLIPSLPL